MPTEYLPVSWEEYHTLAQDLAEKLLSQGRKFDEIVAISRGGLPIGRILSDLLATPISIFSTQSYADLKPQAEVKITKPLTSPIRDKDILLADDVSDTGKTLVRAFKYLKAQQPKTVTTLTLFYKPQSIFKPDYFAKTTSAWIIFPNEVTETIVCIVKMMRKEKKSEEDIKKFLKGIPLSDSQISFAKKYYLNGVK